MTTDKLKIILGYRNFLIVKKIEKRKRKKKQSKFEMLYDMLINSLRSADLARLCKYMPIIIFECTI